MEKNNYTDLYELSIKNPDKFWAEHAKECHWYKNWDSVLDDSNKPFYKWFKGGILNTCYNALDYHVENGLKDHTALIYDSPVTNTVKKYTYLELRDEVALFAGVLDKNGVKKGDRVIIYMPMIPQAAIAMLACARIGAVHSVVFGGFAANELATRIDDAKPKIIVAASCGIEVTKIVKYKPLLDSAIEMSKFKPEKCIVFQRPQEKACMVSDRDIDWNEAMACAKPKKCVEVLAEDPLYILYTSGTTGQPKGVVRDNGGHLVALKWSMKAIYNMDRKDVFWAASDIGWVVGHSYIVYAPLFKGCTSVMYEGKPVGTPDPGAFFRVISDHKVKALFTAPTAFRAIKREDPEGEYLQKYDISCLKSLFLAGERSDPDTILWAEKKLKVPVIDHWWQTETGWGIAANCLGIKAMPVKYGSPTKAVPGWDLYVVDADSNMVQRGTIGALVVKLPLPPGTLITLWQNDKRFKESYLDSFPGYYETSDAGYIDEDGYVYVMARTDDIINVAGHRLSTGALEEVLADHADVAECAVIGVYDQLKGQLPIGMLVLNKGTVKNHEQIVEEVIKMVRERIGPVAAFKTATVIDRLPKTRSGKILRGTIRNIADSVDFKIPATIEDSSIINEMRDALIDIGYPKK